MNIMNADTLTGIPPSRRILVPRNLSLNQAGKCAQQILRLGADGMQPLLVYPHAGSAGFKGIMTICDALALCPAPTIGLAIGSLMNSGCSILQACTTRVMSSFAQIALGDHSWSATVIFGPGQDLPTVYDECVHAEFETLHRMQEETVNALVSHSRLSRQTAAHLLNSETRLTAAQALELGLVDTVV